MNKLVVAPIWRRLLAGLYDSLLLVAIWMLAIALLLPFSTEKVLHVHYFLFRSYLLIVAGVFFIFFWIKGGQTLGMRAWRLQVRNVDDQFISKWQAMGRFLWMVLSVGFMGVGILYAVFNKEKLMWQDYFTHTRVKYYPKLS